MKAIVLTYDKYHSVADHMIHCYGDLWPDHSFTFRLPFQKYPKWLKDKYQERIELIQTPPDIYSTMKELLQDMDDEEWVYWCMDDRYPIHIDIEKIKELSLVIAESNIDGLSFVLSHKDNSIRYSKVLKKIRDGYGNTYYRKKHYGSIWTHQFIKVKVLRNFFDRMPQRIRAAKDMDHYLLNDSILPGRYVLWVSTQSYARFGESASRGMLTQNCIQSMERAGITPPGNFKTTGEMFINNSDDMVQSRIVLRIKDIIKYLLRL